MRQRIIKEVIVTVLILWAVCPAASTQNIMENVGMGKLRLNKIILYVEPEGCRTAFDFYKEGVGLEVVYHAPKYSWCEFKMGEASLCIHQKNDAGQLPVERTDTYLVFEVQSKGEFEKMYNRLRSSRIQVDKRDGVVEGEITKLLLSKTTRFYFFRVCDPAGNTVQFEYQITPERNT